MNRQPWLEAEHEERELIDAEDRAFFQKAVEKQWEENQIKENGSQNMSSITLTFDTEKDSRVDINAAVRAGDLALCIYEMKERIRTEWEMCDEGSRMEKLIDDINSLVENRIGDVWDYTE